MSSSKTQARPWWRAGGIFAPGQRFNIHVPGLVLAAGCGGGPNFPIYLGLWLAYVLMAKYICQMKTETCLFSFASYAMSMFFAGFFLLDWSSDYFATFRSLLRFLLWFWLGTMLKVAISSSACLHRYGAHTAYKTDGWVKYLICIMGAFCNQGGIVWWSSHHRCHHKNCDLPLDPHSPKLVGLENAFAFFNSNRELMKVNEDYVPRHLQDDKLVWFLDTFYWAFCTLEMMVAYAWFGWYGLYISYTTGWWAQVGGMIFNVVFHLEERTDNGKCIAIDGGTWIHDQLYYPAFFLISIFAPTIAPFVGEYYHGIHHVKPQLAKRDQLDVGWYLWVYPLMKLGLIWDVYGYEKQTVKKVA